MKKILIISAAIIVIPLCLYLNGKATMHWRYSNDFKLEECIDKKFTEEQLKYFSVVGFEDKISTARWVKNITISLEKEFTEEDVHTIDTVIQELTPLIQPIKISRVKADGNVKFLFTDTFRKPSMAIGTTYANVKPFTREIYSAKVYVRQFLHGYSRQTTMRHEMMHVLGFTDLDFQSKKSRVFNSRLAIHKYNIRTQDLDNLEAIYKTDYKFTELDKGVIKMLYDPCISMSLKKQDYDLQLNSTGRSKKL